MKTKYSVNKYIHLLSIEKKSFYSLKIGLRIYSLNSLYIYIYIYIYMYIYNSVTEHSPEHFTSLVLIYH